MNPVCPICGSTNCKFVSTKVNYSEEWLEEKYWCNDCNQYFLVRFNVTEIVAV